MSKLLGQMPEFCDAGELWTFWGSAFTSGTCGCGRPVRACPFWLAVADSVFGGDFESERLRLAEIHTNAMGLRKTPAVWMHVRGLKRSHQYDVYARGS